MLTLRWLVVTDVSGQLIGPVFKGQVVWTAWPMNAWPFNMGPISCPETSVTIYQSPLRNVPKERRSQAGNDLEMEKVIHEDYVELPVPVRLTSMSSRSLTIGSRWGEFSVSSSSHLPPFDTYVVGPGANLDVVAKKKPLAPPGIELLLPSLWSVPLLATELL